MTTVNYDPAVPYYDATRGFGPGISDGFRDAVVRLTAASAATSYLELAIGTGLIGLPFIAAGDNYVGVDLSRGMLGEIAPKLATGARPALAQADIARSLPFAADRFDIALAVRIFHLLGDWRRCVSECRRILKPGGSLIIVEVRAPPEASGPPSWSIVHDKWDAILRGLGVGSELIRHGNGLTEATIASHIRAIGGHAEVVDLMRFSELPVSCRTMVERRVRRTFSSDWALQPEVFDEASRQLQRWLDCECEDPDEHSERQMIFRAVLARFA